MKPADIPALPGSYALVLRLQHPINLPVGRVGVFTFPPADYVYFGSACGPGGLRARLQRHLLGSVHPHWHIDFFRNASTLHSVFFLPAHSLPASSLVSLECTWSQAAATALSAFIAAPGFGASDCRHGCPAHLVGLAELPVSLAAWLSAAAGVPETAIQSVSILRA